MNETLRDVRLVSAAEPKIVVVGNEAVYEQRYPQTDAWRTSLRAPALRALDAYDPRVFVVGGDGAVHVALIPAPPDD